MASERSKTIDVAAGDQLTLTVTDLAFGGDGVGRHGDFVVFVPFVVVGETVRVEVTEVKQRYARARLIEVLGASEQRVQPRCRYFGACGGCQYQHLAYPAQLEFKRKQVQDLFQRIGGFDPQAVTTVVACPQPYHYRNRVMVRSQWNKPRQALDIGFVRHDCALVVDVEECAIAEPVLNAQLKQVRAQPPPKGGLKVVLRVLPPDWHVPRDSFFQNNFHLLPALVETVRAALRDSQVEYLMDVYCGVGFFALSLADQVRRFIGVECDQMAVRAARQNMAQRGITNGDFLAGNAEGLLPGLLRCHPAHQTAVVLDPPRTGCPRPSLELLRAVRPRQVIYVSCHPATLARDLSLLCAGGLFELKQLTPLDMFPQTQHVECVADLRLHETGQSPPQPRVTPQTVLAKKGSIVSTDGSQ
jgi:tRNA/tmRNA/rRNA uracil-C5-methylase (TrmA/RlmC/RlmD family)